MSDRWGLDEGACPFCGGDVDWYYFGPDCRGNDSSDGANCVRCKFAVSLVTWEKHRNNATEAGGDEG